MSLPACFPVLNAAYFQAYIRKMEVCGTPEELQEIANEAFGAIALVNSCLNAQINLLAALEVVLVPPGAIADVISWITNLITYLEAQAAPYIKAVAQLAAIVEEVAALTAAIEAAIERLKPNIDIIIPSVDAFCDL